MLPNRTDELIKRIAEAQKTKALANKIGALKSRADKFDRLAGSLESVVRPIALMQAQRVALQLRGNYSSVREYFSKLRALVSEKPETLIEVDAQLGPMQQQIERITEQTERSAHAAWSEDVDRRSKVRVNEAVLRALGKIPEFRESVSAVRNAIQLREALKNRLPESKKDFEKADTIGNEISKTWKAVGSDDIPEAVLNLLHAVGSRAVTLESVDEDVLAWLRKKKLTKYFTLSLANS